MRSATKFLGLTLLLLTGALAGCSRGPDDATLAANVKAKLASNPALAAVNVTAQDGVVTLAGTVATDADKSSAIPVAAQGLEGVLMPGKVVAGHAKLENTAFYTKVAARTVRAVTSPLDRLGIFRVEEAAPG